MQTTSLIITPSNMETQPMRYWALPPALLTFLLLLPSIALVWPGKVVEVTDSDILEVWKGDTKVEVRLYGIDTPESDQPYGMSAKRFTMMMARYERVEVVPEAGTNTDGSRFCSVWMVTANASTKS